MSAAPEFVDANVLVYAHEAGSEFKRPRAIALIAGLLEERRLAISLQVLSEFFVTVTRKLPDRLSATEARRQIDSFPSQAVHSPTKTDVLAAVDLSVRHQIHYWDALIVVSAHAMGASILWTEDLQDGRTFGGVTVRNPFR